MKKLGLHPKINIMSKKKKKNRSARKKNISVTHQKHSVAQLIADALKFHQSNQLTKAEALYIQALGIDPADESVLVNFGILKQNQGKLQESVDWYEKARKKCPESSLLCYNQSRAYIKAGNLSMAVDSLNRALELNPE